ATLYGLTVPTGFVVDALFRGFISHASAGTAVLITSPSETDVVPQAVNGQVTGSNPVAGTGSGTNFTLRVRTNTSGQVRARSTASSTTLGIATYGWMDARGKNQ